jgi:hypothetical protein
MLSSGGSTNALVRNSPRLNPKEPIQRLLAGVVPAVSVNDGSIANEDLASFARDLTSRTAELPPRQAI